MTAAVERAAPVLSWRTKLDVFTRLLAIQGSWNYEQLIGNGIAFALEPALRSLPGGRDGAAYRAALARESGYFNAHPYLAAVAVGALARAELDGLPPSQIERFRTALPGPLGSVGDRLVWAGWLPVSSLMAMLAFGLGAGPRLIVVIFLTAYNVGHLALRLWGLWVGWSLGVRVAPALAHPVLRAGPQYIARAVSALAGMAIPLVVARLLRPGQEGLVKILKATLETRPGVSVALSGAIVPVALLVAVAGAFLLVRLHGRVAGWRVALGALSVLAIYSVVR